jgi:hypothetical protein
MVRTQRVDRDDQHVHAPLRRVARDRGDRRRAEQRRSQETLHRPCDPNGVAGRPSFTTVSRGRAVAPDAATALHRRIAAEFAADRITSAEEPMVDRPQMPEGSS